MKDLLERMSDFSPETRRNALEEFCGLIRTGNLRRRTSAGERLNLHLHTFHSFNCLWWSPSRIVAEGWMEDLRYLGTVDFDSLDGLEETKQAGRLLGMEVMGGFESRVFLREYADKVINSPKEPGIFYLCGKGFPRVPDPAGDAGRFLLGMRRTAQERNRAVVRKLNAFLGAVEIDFEQDVLPLTPSGNPTERHIVLAYQRCSEKTLGRNVDRFWADILHLPEDECRRLRTDRPQDFQEQVRTTLVKFGGPGYIAPDVREFPLFDDVVAMTKAAGGIPVGTWLDGTNPGEENPQQLVSLLREKGIEAITIIPERNWNIRNLAEKREKVANLDEFFSVCIRMRMPVVCGTEMNKFGQPFVDDFSQPELKKYLPYLLESARRLMERSRQE